MTTSPEKQVEKVPVVRVRTGPTKAERLRASRRAAVLDALADVDTPLDVAAICAASGRSAASVMAALDELIGVERIEDCFRLAAPTLPSKVEARDAA